MRIRRASSDQTGDQDLRAVHELVRKAREAGELWAHSWPAHQIDSENKAAELWVVEESPGSADSSAFLGFCFLRAPGSDWEITLVAIDPSARGRGGFQTLIQALRSGVLSDSKRSALSSVFLLEVREDNVAARKAYERAGFVARGRRKAYFHDRADAILYELT